MFGLLKFQNKVVSSTYMLTEIENTEEQQGRSLISIKNNKGPKDVLPVEYQ